VPIGVFYPDGGGEDARRFIRLAFCKDDGAIVEGVRRLAAFRDGVAATGVVDGEA
jgi:hypothetical protein